MYCAPSPLCYITVLSSINELPPKSGSSLFAFLNKITLLAERNPLYSIKRPKTFHGCRQIDRLHILNNIRYHSLSSNISKFTQLQTSASCLTLVGLPPGTTTRLNLSFATSASAASGTIITSLLHFTGAVPFIPAIVTFICSIHTRICLTLKE